MISVGMVVHLNFSTVNLCDIIKQTNTMSISELEHFLQI